MSSFISLSDVDKIYGQTVKTHALASVCLEVKRGEFVVILGPSGSGKTTLLNIVGGLDFPSSGSVAVDGTQLSEMSAQEMTQYRREKVGFVFQFFNLVPSLTAFENVQFAFDLHPGAITSEEALATVGMDSFADRFPSELSGGQQQRVAIARAIAKNPGLLLCDEPTGSLDEDTGRQVLDLLQATARKGCALLLVTHNNALGDAADRVVRMKDGKIISNTRNETPLPAAAISW